MSFRLVLAFMLLAVLTSPSQGQNVTRESACKVEMNETDVWTGTARFSNPEGVLHLICSTTSGRVSVKIFDLAGDLQRSPRVSERPGRMIIGEDVEVEFCITYGMRRGCMIQRAHTGELSLEQVGESHIAGELEVVRFSRGGSFTLSGSFDALRQ